MSVHGLEVEAKGLEDFDPTFFTKHKVIIMIVATYGEGGPTANAEKFHRWMRSPRLQKTHPKQRNADGTRSEHH